VALNLSDWRLRALLSKLGTPYFWARGDLSTGWDEAEEGLDCSGWAQVALREIGIVRSDAWSDLTSWQLAEHCDDVEPGDAILGDLFFYGTQRISHVTVALGGGMCIGANGGGSRTKGDDPAACIQVRPWCYRRDFISAGRIQKEWRP